MVIHMKLSKTLMYPHFIDDTISILKSLIFPQTIGNSAIAQAVLSKDHNHLAGTSFGTFQSINIGYALGLVIAVYVSIGASGAHLNPAVTWAMALTGNISWLMVSTCIYIIYTLYISVVHRNSEPTTGYFDLHLHVHLHVHVAAYFLSHYG